ncbi:hypothetical protein AYK20_05125 [Thermoplasmatales archaeon SG8-52-1]|nr:MAG: hypothetical protein AYK20_05125 [Thermoplasmatales archaeon SG8-52-1]
MFQLFVVKKIYKRFWEIDFLRGVAVVLMIIFHLLYDLNYFDIYKINLYTGPILIYLYFIGSTFLLLVGVSLTLSYSGIKKIFSKKEIQLKYIKRGLKIFSLGLFITFVSWLYLNEGFIIFGVLHCIGLSIILAIPFLKYRYINLSVGFIMIILGIILNNFTFDFNYLLFLGFIPNQFYTVDYFPLLPWFGVVLIGIFVGNFLYIDNKRQFRLKNLDKFRFIRFFGFLGRHSLLIYFIHQPVMLALIHLYLVF